MFYDDYPVENGVLTPQQVWDYIDLYETNYPAHKSNTALVELWWDISKGDTFTDEGIRFEVQRDLEVYVGFDGVSNETFEIIGELPSTIEGINALWQKISSNEKIFHNSSFEFIWYPPEDLYDDLD